MKFQKRIVVVLTNLALIFLLIGCQKDNAIYNNDSTQISQLNNETANSTSTTDKNLLNDDEKLLFQDNEYYYIEKSEVIGNSNNEGNDSTLNETQDYIYKVKIGENKRIMIYKAPERNRNFQYVVSTKEWIYLTVEGYDPDSESYPMGIGRIDKKLNKFKMITSQDAYGLQAKGNRGYFFLHNSQGVSEDIAGIYQLDLESSVYKKIGPVPNIHANPTYSNGMIETIEDKVVYFYWSGDTEEESGKYFVDIETGKIQKISS